MHKAFFCYRHSNSAEAALIRSELENEFSYKKNDIYIARHDEHYVGTLDNKLKEAIDNAENFVIFVTKDCFKKHKDGSNWFIEEIKYAIEHNKPIIPLIFDPKCTSLSNKNIEKDLFNVFNEEETKKLQSYVCLIYSFDHKNDSLTNIHKAIEESHNVTTSETSNILIKAVLSMLCVIALLYGTGCLAGYYLTSADEHTIVMENMTKSDDGLKYYFEHQGVCVMYDPIRNETSDFTLEYKKNLPFLSSIISFSASEFILGKIKNNSELLKPCLKIGNKKVKATVYLIIAAGTIGSVFGFEYGFKHGERIKQEEVMDIIKKNKDNPAYWRKFVNLKKLLEQIKLSNEKRKKDFINNLIKNQKANTSPSKK